LINYDPIVRLPNDADERDYRGLKLPDGRHALGEGYCCVACCTFRRYIGFDMSSVEARMRWVAAQRRGDPVLMCGGEYQKIE
jgi:hypothetical protein